MANSPGFLRSRDSMELSIWAEVCVRIYTARVKTRQRLITSIVRDFVLLRCKLLIVKNAIASLLMIIAVAISPLGQNVPAQKPPSNKRIRVSERVLDNIVLKKVLPQPPWSNDKAHEKGEVTISVLVDYDGTVKSTSLRSGDPILADVATHSIKQWQFKPYVVNDEPVQVESRIVMKFNKKRADVVLGQR
jgi:hypothetical protein